MTYPDRISAVTENLDSYAKAYAELENDEKDLGTWAKAFSETSSEDDAKKLYIKLRVEQLDASEPQAQPEVNETPLGTAQSNYTPPISNVEETPPSGSSTKLEFFLRNIRQFTEGDCVKRSNIFRNNHNIISSLICNQ